MVFSLFMLKEKTNMFKAIKDNKIIGICEDNYFPCLVHDSVEEDTEHSVFDYEQYNGEYLLKEKIPIEVKNEQIRQQRQARYIAEADPLRLDWDESSARGEEQAEEKKQLWLAKKDEIRNDLPYIEEAV